METMKGEAPNADEIGISGEGPMDSGEAQHGGETGEGGGFDGGIGRRAREDAGTAVGTDIQGGSVRTLSVFFVLFRSVVIMANTRFKVSVFYQLLSMYLLLGRDQDMALKA